MSKYLQSILFITTTIFLSGCGTDQRKHTSEASLKKVIPVKSEYTGTVFEQVYNKLEAGSTLSSAEIEHFSKDIATRADFYNLLATFNQEALFPREYYTFEKAAEGVLVNWLVYPTELDTVPSNIELIKKVALAEHDTTFIYYVFQFKTEPPHWAAKNGWMIGVAGPYLTDSKPYDWTSGTFSRFSKARETSPEKEVAWIHENVYRRSPE